MRIVEQLSRFCSLQLPLERSRSGEWAVAATASEHCELETRSTENVVLEDESEEAADQDPVHQMDSVRTVLW